MMAPAKESTGALFALKSPPICNARIPWQGLGKSRSAAVWFSHMQYADAGAIDQSWLYWFTGFFDGEGSFTAHAIVRKNTSNRVTAGLAVCQKDRMVLDELTRMLKCGTIQVNRTCCIWRVHRVAILKSLFIPIFDCYPLHTRKANEYILWRALVGSRADAMRSTDQGIMEYQADLVRQIQTIKHGGQWGADAPRRLMD